MNTLSYFHLTTVAVVLAKATTIVSSKGQVILPKPLRDALRWTAGTRLVVEASETAIMLRAETADFPATDPQSVYGCLGDYAHPIGVDDMKAAISREVKRRHAGGRY